jgi:acetolactate synthase I/II/III large subunit
VRTGGQILVDALEANGVDLAFCVPGESYLPVLDALHDSPIRLISARHEASAANMAEAYGKLTGRPGICIVTRGPGATHASVGVHTAWQDSTPMLLLVGQVPREALGREAFQEIDYGAFFGSTAWVAQAESAVGLPKLVSEAIAATLSARPGPAVLALPEDVLFEEADVADAEPIAVTQPSPSPDDLARIRELLVGAERPLVVVGEGGWTRETGEYVLAFCEANELPVAASFRCQDYVDNHSTSYTGHLTIGMDPALARRVQDADVVLAIGGRLGDVTTRGYTLIEVPRPRQRLVHAHPDPNELGAVYEPELGIVSGLPELAAGLRTLAPVEPRWRDWTAGARADYLANLEHRRIGRDLDLGDAMATLRERLPEDAIVTSGAGNFTVWAHRFYEFSVYPSQLAPRSGAMAYGIAAALTAKAVFPDRVAVCIAGDGDFLMSGQELATAVQYELPFVVLVVNNGMLGTIRMHQERLYPGRVVGTDLVNPDFAALAAAFGAHGERVKRIEDFPDALERALRAGRPALVELCVDPEAISPRQTIAEIREAYDG